MGRPAALPRRRHGGLLLALHAGGERPRRDRDVRREPRARAASAGPSSGWRRIRAGSSAGRRCRTPIADPGGYGVRAGAAFSAGPDHLRLDLGPDCRRRRGDRGAGRLAAARVRRARRRARPARAEPVLAPAPVRRRRARRRGGRRHGVRPGRRRRVRREELGRRLPGALVVGAGARLRRRRLRGVRGGPVGVGPARLHATAAVVRLGGTVLRCRRRPRWPRARAGGACAPAPAPIASRWRAPPRRGPRTCSGPGPGRAPRRRSLAAPPRGGDARGAGLAASPSRGLRGRVGRVRRRWARAGRVGRRGRTSEHAASRGARVGEAGRRVAARFRIVDNRYWASTCAYPGDLSRCARRMTCSTCTIARRITPATVSPHSRPRYSCRRDQYGHRQLIDRALAEDVGDGDVTVAATVDPGARGVATITQKAPGVISGLGGRRGRLPAPRSQRDDRAARPGGRSGARRPRRCCASTAPPGRS